MAYVKVKVAFEFIYEEELAATPEKLMDEVIEGISGCFEESYPHFWERLKIKRYKTEEAAWEAVGKE
jgi:hypothetical protein